MPRGSSVALNDFYRRHKFRSQWMNESKKQEGDQMAGNFQISFEHYLVGQICLLKLIALHLIYNSQFCE